MAGHHQQGHACSISCLSAALLSGWALQARGCMPASDLMAVSSLGLALTTSTWALVCAVHPLERQAAQRELSSLKCGPVVLRTSEAETSLLPACAPGPDCACTCSAASEAHAAKQPLHSTTLLLMRPPCCTAALPGKVLMPVCHSFLPSKGLPLLTSLVAALQPRPARC